MLVQVRRAVVHAADVAPWIRRSTQPTSARTNNGQPIAWVYKKWREQSAMSMSGVQRTVKVRGKGGGVHVGPRLGRANIFLTGVSRHPFHLRRPRMSDRAQQDEASNDSEGCSPHGLEGCRTRVAWQSYAAAAGQAVDQLNKDRHVNFTHAATFSVLGCFAHRKQPFASHSSWLPRLRARESTPMTHRRRAWVYGGMLWTVRRRTLSK